MEDLVTCSVCLRKFEDPRVLPCQHTFCLKPCLERLFESSFRHIKCPLCRETHFVTKGHVGGLPKNFTIQSLMDMPVDIPLNNKVCELCNINTNIVRNCECCSKNICKKCYDTHIKKTKEKLSKLNDKLKHSLIIEKKSYGKLLKELSSLESDRNTLCLTIGRFFNEINSLLQQRKCDMIQAVTDMYGPTYSTLKSLVETKEIDVAVLSSSIHSAADSIEKDSTSQGHLLSLLASIESTLPVTNSLEGAIVNNIVSGELIYDIESIRAVVSNFGELKWISGDIPSCSNDGSTEISRQTDKPPDTSQIINGHRSNTGDRTPVGREKTFTLNRPSKSISYEIPVSTLITMPATLSSIYRTKSMPIMTFGVKGTGIGEFIWPRGIAVDNETNRIIVADSSNHRIQLSSLQIFTGNGSCEKVISELTCNEQAIDDVSLTFDCLSGVAVGKLNRIVCSDRYNHRAIVMDMDGQLICELGKDVTGDSRLSYPWGIAIDGNGNIMVCDKDNHRIQIFSSSGRYLKEIGSYGRQVGKFDNPHYLAICPKTKNIFVSDTSNHRIQVFDKNGTYLYSFGGDGPSKFHLKYPRGITIDQDGNILICDYGNNRISIFSNEGKSMYIFGSHGSNNGQFKGLEGIGVFSDGRIVVSDRDNHRIQIF